MFASLECCYISVRATRYCCVAIFAARMNTTQCSASSGVLAYIAPEEVEQQTVVAL